MKFNFTPEIVIGILLILWGASILIKIFFNIDIPIFRPLLAIFLIYWGITILFNPGDNYLYKRYIYTYKSKHNNDKQEFRD